MVRRRFLLVLGACLVVAAIIVGVQISRRTPPPLKGFEIARDIPLPGDTSRFDYQSFEPTRHLLFIAHLGASEVVVYDIEHTRVIKTIPNVSDVHGVVAVPEQSRVYATATGVDRVDVIDERSLTVIDSVPTGDYPDGLAYDSRDHKLYVSNESGGSVTVIDTRTDRVVATINLGGEVGNTQYDASTYLIYSAVQSRNEIVKIDPTTDRVIARKGIGGCEGPHGIYLDTRAGVAFVACEDNATLVVLSLDTFEAPESYPVGDGPDVLAFDPDMRQLYVASESGVLSVFRYVDSKISKVAEGWAGPNAHTVSVDPRTHFIYLPLPDIRDRPVLRILEPLD